MKPGSDGLVENIISGGETVVPEQKWNLVNRLKVQKNAVPECLKRILISWKRVRKGS